MSGARSFRQSMAWLHTWAGLIVGWVLFAIFVTGTASYYRTDISRWMRPELAETVADPVQAATRAGLYLRRQMPEATNWYVALPRADDPEVQVYWWTLAEGIFHHARLDPVTGEPSAVRATQGGDFLYQFHYQLSLPPILGRWIVAICAMILLVSLISGVITHRRIFADFFTFRRDRSAQRAWLDAHNVVGVLALPYHLMIVYTGLVTLAPLVMPWGLMAAYRQDEPAFYTETGIMAATRPPVGRRGQLLPLGTFVSQAIVAGGEVPEGLSISNPGDAAATVTALFEEPPGLVHLHPQIAYAGDTGVAFARTGEAGPATRTGAGMIGLHEAHFAATPLRLLFVLCGVLGAATVATGLVLWTVARAPKGTHPAGFGLRLVRSLNLGTLAGLPVGLAGYLLANRLLPTALEARAAWEIRGFFAAWIGAALLSALYPRAKAWPVALAVAAAAFLAIPAVDAVTVGQARFLGFDAVMAVLGVLLLFAARLTSRRPGTARRAGVTVPGVAEA